jgi:hypothetical protein
MQVVGAEHGAESGVTDPVRNIVPSSSEIKMVIIHVFLEQLRVLCFIIGYTSWLLK